MLTAVDIINTLQQGRIIIDTVGEVTIYPESIIVGNNSVASQCRIRGIEGDILLKCLFSPAVTPNQSRQSVCVTYIDIDTLSGDTFRTCCLLRRWIDGITLDDAVLSGMYNYKSLSTSFDRLAYEILSAHEAHGDISPDNILVCNDKMQLIDNDATWHPNHTHNHVSEYGSPGFIHSHRKIKLPAKDIDNYPIAIISTLLAAISHYATESAETIPAILLKDIAAPSHRSIELAKQKLLDADDIAHYNIACSIDEMFCSTDKLKRMFKEAIKSQEE